MEIVGVIFSLRFLILMDRDYSWGVLPSIDGYFFIYMYVGLEYIFVLFIYDRLQCFKLSF